MHRSASSTRIGDENLSIYHSSPSKLPTSIRALSLETNDLLTYESSSDVPKKERAHTKFAENVIHIIPFVLLFCALVLWLFSNPDIDLAMQGNPIDTKVEGLSLGEVDSEGTQTGNLPLQMGDLDFGKEANRIGLDSDSKFM